MPIVVDTSRGDGGGISAEVIETSVTITDYLQSQLLRITLTWRIKLSGLKVLLCSNYLLFITDHKKWII